MKRLTKILGSFAAVSLFALVALPAYASVEKVSAFVCPVITAEAVGEHNPIAGEIGEGHYTVVPSTANNGYLMVPAGATNGDGYGTPGDHSAPGETDYTAIWARQQ